MFEVRKESDRITDPVVTIVVHGVRFTRELFWNTKLCTRSYIFSLALSQYTTREGTTAVEFISVEKTSLIQNWQAMSLRITTAYVPISYV